jgi:hypothetical protein
VKSRFLPGICGLGPDLADLQEIEAEGLDLAEDAVERSGVRQQAGEYSFGALLLGHECRERRQQGGAEVAVDPELVQDRTVTHASMIGSGQVSRRRRNPVIVVRSGQDG